MVASASAYPVWGQACNNDLCPPDCPPGASVIIRGVSNGKVVVDEVIGGKVVKKHFLSEKQVRRAEEKCPPNDNDAQNWRRELSKQLKALEKSRKN
jgi:hypothetical protein